MTVRRQGWRLDLGLVDYDEALELQTRCEAARKACLIPDLLILLEHPPVYTYGRGADLKHLLLDQEDLEKQGIKLREIRRGGDITFHGPGQIVGYPIIDLQNHGKDAHLYLRKLEDVLKATLEEFELQPYTVEGKTGVWCGDGKIAAIGVGISRWITTHGFALNVNTDLNYFGGIVPCGLHGMQATSMKAQSRHTIDMEAVKNRLVGNFGSQFELEMSGTELAKLTELLNAV